MTTSASRDDPGIIRFTVADTRLGKTLIASSHQGVVAVFFGDDPAVLQGHLADVLPRAQLAEDASGLAETVARTAAVIDDPRRVWDLPFDLRGSASCPRFGTP